MHYSVQEKRCQKTIEYSLGFKDAVLNDLKKYYASGTWFNQASVNWKSFCAVIESLFENWFKKNTKITVKNRYTGILIWLGIDLSVGEHFSIVQGTLVEVSLACKLLTVSMALYAPTFGEHPVYKSFCSWCVWGAHWVAGYRETCVGIDWHQRVLIGNPRIRDEKVGISVLSETRSDSYWTFDISFKLLSLIANRQDGSFRLAGLFLAIYF